MNKYKTLVSNTFLISIGIFGSKLLVFLMVRFYTGYLTPADYGTADLLTQTANLLIPLVSLGITDGVFRFALEGKTNVFTAGFYTVLAGACLLLAAVPAIERVSCAGGYGWLIAVLVSSSCFHGLCAQFVRAQGNTVLFAVQGLVNTGLVIALNLLFLAVFSLGITGYVLSVAVANLLTVALLVWNARLWRQLVPRPPKGLLGEMFRYSVPLIPTSVFWWITGVSDRHMVNAFLGSDATGLYSVAYKIPTILTILSTIFMDAWQVSAVTESGGSRKAHTQFYSNVWRVFQAAVFLCGAGIISLSPLAIQVLATQRYHTAWVCIPTLTLAMVFSSFSNFMGNVYVVTKKSTQSLWTRHAGGRRQRRPEPCADPVPPGHSGGGRGHIRQLPGGLCLPGRERQTIHSLSALSR